ncbi:zinc ribbon domain-containing protein [Arthrobacter sp. ISL-65]|uniref:zinc ribbon domain-containing protein n=1 Tax=Arthrobacter sp. ISL-65 TaxID=2819112 RepID=UPI001BE812D2|nr:zinc ribbon domain-containing protein [Arthrobacter sp. ISL-65]
MLPLPVVHSLDLLLKVLLAVVIAAGLTGASSPAPSSTPSPTPTMQSGMEGSKAALVRIELVAVAEIAHIDHSSGEVEMARGRSIVPLRSATGILLSADGIVATTWESLTLDKDTVAAYAANELFASKMHVPIVGNNGNRARRGSTPDPHWGPHLQHCYKQVTHCVLFTVAQYHVRTYTSKPGDVVAELLNTPSKPNDVALLRISGGGAAPTAALASTAAAPKVDGMLLGFTQRPTPKVAPVELPTKVDARAARVQSATNLAAPLLAGVASGPVVDQATGQILGLAGSRQPDGGATLVPAAAIRAALVKTGLQASPSRFDAVFRRGIDHLVAGNQGGSAESALEESLTYFDSALATNRLAEARALGAKQASKGQAQAAGDKDTATSSPGALVPVLLGALLLAVIGGAMVLVRRRAASATASAASGSRPAASHPPASGALRAAAQASDHSRASVERTELTKAAGDNDRHASRGRSHSVRTDAGEHHSPAQPQARTHFATPPAPGSDSNTHASAQPGAGETRFAGPLAPRAVGGAVGEVAAFCFRCGRQVQPEWRFCVSCGQRMG